MTDPPEAPPRRAARDLRPPRPLHGRKHLLRLPVARLRRSRATSHGRPSSSSSPAFLDGLDGRVARMTDTTSAFGEQLDSLADVVSFGVAPCVPRLPLGARRVRPARPRRRRSSSSSAAPAASRDSTCRCTSSTSASSSGCRSRPRPARSAGLIWIFPEPLPTRELRSIFLVVTILLSFLMVSTFRYRSFKDIDLRSRRSAILVPLVGLVLAAIFWQPAWSFGALLVDVLALRPGRRSS